MGVHLSPEERNWVWGVIGKQAAQRLSSDAVTYFGNVTKDSDLTDDLLGWKARAALRAGQWKVVRKAVEAMGDDARRDSTWVYWHAKAVLNGKPSDAERAEARQALESIASPKGFTSSWPWKSWASAVVPPAPAPSQPRKGRRPRQPALNRALYAILLGIRGEGVREWNYATNLHTPAA